MKSTEKKLTLKDISSYSFLALLISSLILYSSALKIANGDYYIAFEIIKSLSIQSWLTGNIATIALLTAATFSPFTYYIANYLILNYTNFYKKFKKPWKYYATVFILSLLLLTLLALFIEFILGFQGFLDIYRHLVFVALLPPLLSFALVQHYGKNRFLHKILLIISTFLSLTLLISCIYVIKDSSILGQSCLLKVTDRKTERIATIFPLEFNKDSIKSIYLDDYPIEENNRQGAYIKFISIDESYSIYPNSCDKVDLNY